MQYAIHAATRGMAVAEAGNIAFVKPKTSPLNGGHPCLHILKIVPMAGGKVIEADDILIQQQQ